jgi:hypothetical protein
VSLHLNKTQLRRSAFGFVLCFWRDFGPARQMLQLQLQVVGCGVGVALPT